MRTDQDGKECPATLGEYRDMCAALGGEACAAVRFLDDKIAKHSRDEAVLTPDSQMRLLLLPMLFK